MRSGAEGGANDAHTTRPLVRLVCSAALLLVEYLLIAVLYDGGRLVAASGGLLQLGNAGNLVAIGSAVLTAGLLARGGSLWTTFRAAELGAPSIGALAVHGLSFAMFLGVTHALFAGDALHSTWQLAWTLAWVASALANLASLFWVATGASFAPLARALVPVLASGAVTGGLAWYLAWLLRPAWPWLVAQTLPLSAGLLRAMLGDERVQASGSILALDGFRVSVEPECSGVEGLIVITVLLVGYLVACRSRLRFPNALLLLPLAVIVVFTFNVMRIAALVMIGAFASPAVALGGFHSRAGWLSVCGVALGMLWVSEQNGFFARERLAPLRTHNPALPYCLPLLVSTAFAMVTGLFMKGRVDWLYGLHVAVTAVVIVRYRRELPLSIRPFSSVAVLNGVVVFVLWYWLARRPPTEDTYALMRELFAAPAPTRVVWCVSRVVGSVLVVPISEELAFRGFLQRRLIASDFEQVSLRRFTWASLLGSAVAFGAVHQSIVAGVLAGAAFSVAGYRRASLGDAIVAHATANALIAVAVLGFGHWWLW